ncbi:MAG: hypothetical protein LE169_05685 [Endomicrobium sp.]|nr:hypothetical protein [Endomicrobium sp.]
MKRNIVILLCLVFFTQSAFAWFGNDCKRKRKAYKQERNTCYQNNDRCQELRKADARKIAELEDKVKKLEAQNENWKIGTGVAAVVIGIGGGIAYVVCQPFRILRDLIVQLLGIIQPAADEDQA